MQPTLGQLFTYSRVCSGADNLQGMASSLTAFKHNTAIGYFLRSLVNQIQPSLNLHLLVLTRRTCLQQLIYTKILQKLNEENYCIWT